VCYLLMGEEEHQEQGFARVENDGGVTGVSRVGSL